MYEGKTHTLFAKYAIPQMIGLLFNSIYVIVDGIFIGNRLGRDAMAAAAVSVPFVEILIALSMSVVSGADVMASGQLGRNERENALQTFHAAILCTTSFSGIIIVLGNIFIHPLAKILGSTPQIHDEAVSYLWYIVTFSPFLLFSFLLGGLARNDGRPKLVMLALATAIEPVFSYFVDIGNKVRNREMRQFAAKYSWVSAFCAIC